jgi:uncharacterized RDD family membrane protein YckC
MADRAADPARLVLERSERPESRLLAALRRGTARRSDPADRVDHPADRLQAQPRVYFLLQTIMSLGYYTYFEGGPTGQKIGKRALGIRVYDFREGGAIGYGRGFVRQIGKYLSAIVFFLGYFWMLWDKEKQCWQDKLAGSVVVPADAYR